MIDVKTCGDFRTVNSQENTIGHGNPDLPASFFFIITSTMYTVCSLICLYDHDTDIGYNNKPCCHIEAVAVIIFPGSQFRPGGCGFAAGTAAAKLTGGQFRSGGCGKLEGVLLRGDRFP